MDLKAALEEMRPRIEAALECILSGLEEGLSPPLGGAIRHGVLEGGKRIRPALCVAAYRASGGGGPERDAYRMAASVELVHSYSLMHDDLPCMDDADLRRGRPTPHLIYGEAATMTAGAVLIPVAAREAWSGARAVGCSDETAREVARVLLHAAGAAGMVGGQALDLMGEGGPLSREELDTLHRKKTGALLAAAPRMGGMAAGAGEWAVRALHRYGLHLGLAFQIADDILDAVSTAGALGKNPSDAALGKSTYVTLHGVEKARERAIEEAHAARESLQEGGVRSPLLDELAGYVVERKH